MSAYRDTEVNAAAGTRLLVDVMQESVVGVVVHYERGTVGSAREPERGEAQARAMGDCELLGPAAFMLTHGRRIEGRLPDGDRVQTRVRLFG